MPKNKCTKSRGTVHWTNLEKHAADMVNENCQNGHTVDKNGVWIFAFKWANQSKIKAKGSGQLHHGILILWKANDLVLRQKTKTAQKLTGDLDSYISMAKQYNSRRNTITH
jgi:hypothetical protein